MGKNIIMERTKDIHGYMHACNCATLDELFTCDQPCWFNQIEEEK